jgi:hypothetical protein
MERQDLERLCLAGLSQRAIAVQMGCSQSHVHRSLRRYGLKTAKRGRTLQCPVCERFFDATHATQKYCSRRCAMAARYKTWIAEWLAGEREGGNPHGVSDHVRRWLIEQRGERCETCGWSERHPVTGRVPVEIHHTAAHDDHTPDNLMLLCPNHHSLTPTYRALNKGKGRAYRRDLDRQPSPA